MQIDSSPTTGKLLVTVAQAHDLPDQRKVLSLRTFKYRVIVRVGNSKHSTCEVEIPCSWNETFSFDFSETSSIRLEVYRRHRLTSDVLVGKFEQRLLALLSDASDANHVEDSLRFLPLESQGTQETRATISLKLEPDLSNDYLSMAAAIQRAKAKASRLYSPLSLRLATAISNGSVDGGIYDSDPALIAITEAWTPLLFKLEILATLTDHLADLHPYAKAAYSVIRAAYNLVVAQVQRDSNILHLIMIIDDIFDFVKEADPLSKVESHRQIITRIAQQTRECGYFICDYCKGSFWSRAVKNSASLTDAAIVEYGAKFAELKAALQSRIIINTEIMVLQLWKDVQRIATEIDLSDLPYAEGARFQSSKQCIPGTRQEIIADIVEWIDNPPSNHSCMLVLHGTTGSGKSSIASSVARHFFDLGRLGSSIFIDPTVPATCQPVLFFPTIARDLTALDPQFSYALAEGIRSDMALRKTRGLSDQLEHFIIRPSNHLTLTGPIVVVIDGIDFVDDTDALFDFVFTLQARLHDLPLNFRFILTTRTHNSILRMLKVQQAVMFKDMADINDLSTKHDLLIYAKASLHDLATGLYRNRLNEIDFRKLVDMSKNSFSWMAQTCDFLRGHGTSSHGFGQRFDATLRTDDRPLLTPSWPHLYLEDLRSILNPKDFSEVARFKSVMGDLLVAREALSVQDLEVFRRACSLPVKEVLRVIEQMSPFLKDTAYRTIPIHPHNPSFYEFLEDESRSKAFYIDVYHHTSHFAYACLRVLNTQLRFNIANLKSSYAANSDVEDLQERIERFISPPLAYASRYWAEHVVVVPATAELQEQIRQFLQNGLLFWLEVLSLLDCLSVAAPAMSRIADWISPHEHELGVLAADTASFIDKFHPIIAHSAPHIYLSALAFSPKRMTISQVYRPRFSIASVRHFQGDLRVLKSHRSPVCTIAFSPSGNQVVSVSSDQVVYLWEVDTAIGDCLRSPLQPMPGKSRYIGEATPSTAFTPDGNRIVVYHARSLTVFGAATGRLLFRYALDLDVPNVSFTCFSPDVKRIACAHKNEIRILRILQNWDLPQLTLKGHTSRVTSMAFSHNGKLLVSGSDDFTIRLWDLDSGDSGGSPIYGSTSSVDFILWSPDDSRVISCSRASPASSDKTSSIIIWDIQGGEAISKIAIPEPGNITSIAMSPDGRHIAYAQTATSTTERRCSIHLMNLETAEHLPTTLPLSVDSVSVRTASPLTISPDGSMLSVGCSDNIARLWPIGKPWGEVSLWGKGSPAKRSGMVLGPQRERLLWVLPDFREGMLWSRIMCGEAYGTAWTRCYNPESHDVDPESEFH